MERDLLERIARRQIKCADRRCIRPQINIGLNKQPLAWAEHHQRFRQIAPSVQFDVAD